MTNVITLELGFVHRGQRNNVATWKERLTSGDNSLQLKEELQKEIESTSTTLSLNVYDRAIIKESASGFGTIEVLLHQLIGVSRKILRSGMHNAKVTMTNQRRLMFKTCFLEVAFLRGTSDDSENAFYVFEPRPPRDVVRISKFSFFENVSYAIKEEDGCTIRKKKLSCSIFSCISFLFCSG